MIPIQFVLDTYISKGKSLYVKEDYYIKFVPEVNNTSYNWRLSIDTLSFLVEPETKIFIALDAYCPTTYWLIEDLKIPLINQRVAIRFNVDFDSNGIGIRTKDFRLQYIACPDKSIVLIRLLKTKISQYVQFADSLIAGLDYENNLVEIFIYNIDIK